MFYPLSFLQEKTFGKLPGKITQPLSPLVHFKNRNFNYMSVAFHDLRLPLLLMPFVCTCLSDVTSCLNQILPLYVCTHGCALIPNRRLHIIDCIRTKCCHKTETAEKLQSLHPACAATPQATVAVRCCCAMLLNEAVRCPSLPTAWFSF